MVGDAETQPTESVDALTELANAFDPEAGQEDEENAQAETDEDSDEDESEEADEEEAEEAGEDEEEPTFTIKHDGKDVTLKQSELVEMAQKGFDYSKKTMAVADDRKAVEAARDETEGVRKQVDGLRDDAIRQLQTLAGFIEHEVGQPPSIQLAHQNAAEYIAQKALYDQRTDKLQQVRASIDHLQQDQHRERQAAFSKRIEATARALKDTLPDWDDAKGQDLIKYLESEGLNYNSLGDGIAEKGLFLLAHKAKQLDAILAKKAQMKPKEKLAKVAKPSAQNQSAKATERVKRDAAFNKSPSVDSLAEFFR